MASSQVQRWALALSAYQYNIEHKAGSCLCHADGLSRLPRPAIIINDGQTPEMIFLINHLSSTCMTASYIKELMLLNLGDLDVQIEPVIPLIITASWEIEEGEMWNRY